MLPNILNRDRKINLLSGWITGPGSNWLPAAEQIEWIQYGGILEPVKLVSTSQTYIDDLIIRTIPDKDGAQINCMI